MTLGDRHVLRRWSRLPRFGRIAIGILTSSAVFAAAGYGIAFAVASGPQSRGSSPGATARTGMAVTGRSSLPGAFAWLASTVPPSTWSRVTVPSGLGLLSVPPGFRAVSGDAGSTTLADLSPSGTYLGYVNVTRREGDESLADWSGLRLAHLRSDETISASQDAAVESVRTGKSLRSCVTDDYVTEIGRRHFHEVACFVMARSTASVVVAATPSGDPAHLWAQLERSVAAYPSA